MTSGERPHVVVVMRDDMAWGALTWHGDLVVATPHLDALWVSSTCLTCYASGPLRTPARASFMTGCHHQRTRAIDRLGSERTLVVLTSDHGPNPNARDFMAPEWLVEVETGGGYWAEVRLEPFSWKWKEPRIFSQVCLSVAALYVDLTPEPGR